MRRHLLGVMSLAFLGFAAIVCLSPPLAAYQGAGLIGVRIGLVLGVLWIAWPDLLRLPKWTWFAVLIGLLLVVFARGVLVFAAPVLAAALAVYLLYRRLRRPV